MSSIVNSLTTEQIDAIIAVYGTVLDWVEQVANAMIYDDIVL